MEDEFTLHEVLEMRRIYQEMGEESLSPVFCQRLATSFNLESHIARQPITWEQVQNWFKDRKNMSRSVVGASPMHCNSFTRHSDPSVLSKHPESSQKPRDKGIPDISGLTFEARSAKDDAWYDVACFLNYRNVSSGELEVRVRFAGFRNTEDEWVNVKRAVRERSTPLESSECPMVKVGDPVLCFQEREDRAFYRDAHVARIQRRNHDTIGCQCIFWVCYDHDYSEEAVGLDKLCSRAMQSQ